MSQKKKAIRQAFRESVFERDMHRCRKCGVIPEDGDEGLDAHHIRNRNEFDNGGYVKENGISLCGDASNDCHRKAEAFHETGISLPGYSPDDLYALIGSNFAKAIRADKKLA